jgi:hypothetical protein
MCDEKGTRYLRVVLIVVFADGLVGKAYQAILSLTIV